MVANKISIKIKYYAQNVKFPKAIQQTPNGGIETAEEGSLWVLKKAQKNKSAATDSKQFV